MIAATVNAGELNIQTKQATGAPTRRRPTHLSFVRRRAFAPPTIIATIASPRVAGLQRNLPPCYEVMKFMIPILFSTASLMYQGRPETLLTENPAPLSIFLVSTCVYWFIVRKMKQRPYHDDSSDTKSLRILGQVACVSEVVSPSSLISVILKNQLSFMLAAFWTLVGLGILWLLFYSTYIFRMSINSFISRILVNEFWGKGSKLTPAAEENVPPRRAQPDEHVIQIHKNAPPIGTTAGVAADGTAHRFQALNIPGASVKASMK